MTVQVLVATMRQKDHSLLEKMNISSDTIIGNQCDQDLVERFKWKNHQVTYLNFAERGVGLNRNNSLMRATGDICLFADDDMRYIDEYEEMVIRAFKDNPDADVVVFNLHDPTNSRFMIKNIKRVSYWNFLRYGTARIAVRTAKIRAAGIYFNQCFGGGTEHCHGEDNLFLAECLKRGLHVYSNPAVIAELTEERKSSWNSGYDEKYLRDQGVLYKTMFRKLWFLFCMQDVIRHSSQYNMKPWSAYKKMRSGELQTI